MTLRPTAIAGGQLRRAEGEAADAHAPRPDLVAGVMLSLQCSYSFSHQTWLRPRYSVDLHVHLVGPTEIPRSPLSSSGPEGSGEIGPPVGVTCVLKDIDTYFCCHDRFSVRGRNLPGAYLVHVPARYDVLDTIMRNHVPTAVL